MRQVTSKRLAAQCGLKTEPSLEVWAPSAKPDDQAGELQSAAAHSSPGPAQAVRLHDRQSTRMELSVSVSHGCGSWAQVQPTSATLF